MPVITIFSGSFCNEKQVVQEVLSQTGYRLLADKDAVAPSVAVNLIVGLFVEATYGGVWSFYPVFLQPRQGPVSH